MPTTKSTPLNSSPTSLILGIFSIVFGLIPFLGLGLAIAGLVVAGNGTRTYETTKDGNHRYLVFVPWSKIPGVRKAGGILSLLGLVVGLITTVVGSILIIGLSGNFHFS